MDDCKLRLDMMRLWKDTFADNDEYIKIVFDNYFNPDLCFTIYACDKLLSSMLCVEYLFCEKQLCLKSAYQCGLATLPEFRNRGLMRRLIERANCSLYDNKFVLSFLIPADDKLRQYYKHSGYVDVAFMNNYIYFSGHNFIKNKILLCRNNIGLIECRCNNVRYHVYDVYNMFNVVSKDDLDIKHVKFNTGLCTYLYDVYSKFIAIVDAMSGIVAKYSFDDFLAICLDNYISGGKILCLTDDNNKPLSIIFCSNIGEGSATVQLQVSYSEEAESLLLQILKFFLPGQTTMTVRRYGKQCKLDNNLHVLTSPCSSADLKVCYSECGAQAGLAAENMEVMQKPYAMVKILNVLEVLKFVADLYHNSEFSILINSDPIRENEGLFVVRRGAVQFTPKETMSSDELHEAKRNCSSRSDWFSLTVPGLAALLFRRSDFGFSESVATVPKLSMTVALMLE